MESYDIKKKKKKFPSSDEQGFLSVFYYSCLQLWWGN